jgi:uncharacterized protein (TIGR04141 family)
LDTVSRLTREQLSKDSGLEQFGLDIERDLLRAVTGTPKDAVYGKRLTGADRLVVTGDIPLTALGDALDRYADLAERDAYKEHFAFVDYVEPIRDRAAAGDLTDALIKRLNDRRLDGIYMAVPEIVEWADVGGFRYGNRRDSRKLDSLDVREFLNERREILPLTRDKLKDERVRLIDAVTDENRSYWPAFRCLVAEIKISREQFVLSAGEWYKVAPQFLQSIDAAVAAIPTSTLPLPPCHREIEENYNERVAQTSNGYFVLLDRRTVRIGSRSAIEICDLYGRDRAFVHVKRYGGSTTISHLLNQGLVSAQLLMYEREYRHLVSERLPQPYRWGNPDDNIRGEDFEVCFAIVADPGKDVELPFFSKVALRNTVRLLQGMRYRVTRATVPNP